MKILIIIQSSPIMSERLKAHALAYAVFTIGVISAWCRATGMSDFSGIHLVLIGVWFPAAVVEVFRRSGISNYGFAAALIAGMCGFDGTSRMFYPFYSNGC
ncbi:MAG: hypothetical protein NWR03_09685 [Akkermansiaceae bacterium]|nr:hypothetical protein [Akkermansiaceae bacterium]MDP4898031.1 hypothetical protein [Akkermansiaceae bacterium]